MKIVIAHSHILSAFAERTIGTKVVDVIAFNKALEEAIETFSFPENGQAVIPLSCLSAVSAGVAKLRDTFTEDDFVVRKHRGHFSAYVRREYAAPVESLRAVVYTLKAYGTDPDAKTGPEAETVQREMAEFERSGATHVLIAVLAHAGTNAPYPTKVLIHNIAGGNDNFLPLVSADSIELACEIMADPSESPARKQGASKDVLYDLQLLHKFIKLAKEAENHSREYVLVAD